MVDLAAVENIVQVDIFLCNIHIVERIYDKRACEGQGGNTPILYDLRYNSHICHVSKINARFKAYGCPSCDQFIIRAHDLERHLTTCKERVKHVIPKNVNQLRETLFDKRDSFGKTYTDDQNKSMENFDFESISVQEDNIHDTDTTTWTSKHVPIFVSVSSNMIKESILLCNSNPRDLVESFVDDLDGLATQSKAQLKVKISKIETSVKSKHNQFSPFYMNVAVTMNENINWRWAHRRRRAWCIDSFYKHTRINLLICRITWKDSSSFVLSLASTAQITTLI